MKKKKKKDVGKQDWKMGEVFGGYEGNPARNDEGDSEGISERTTKNALRNGSLIKECVELP